MSGHLTSLCHHNVVVSGGVVLREFGLTDLICERAGRVDKGIQVLTSVGVGVVDGGVCSVFTGRVDSS